MIYPCDPEKNTRCNKTGCYITGGECSYTTRKEFAKQMKIKLDKGAYMPVREHDTDAGLDLRAMDRQYVPAKESAIFHTGVHVEIPRGCAGLIISKSGLNVHHDITSTGLIDEGYTGEILVKLHNHGCFDYLIEAGDKISQLVIFPVRYEPLELVDSFEGLGRGNNGFGSTGR